MTRPAAGIAFCICCLNLLRLGFSQGVIAGLVTVLVISLGYDLAKDIYYGLTAWFEKREKQKAERISKRIAELNQPHNLFVEVDSGHNGEWVVTSAFTHYDMIAKEYKIRSEELNKLLKRRAMEDEYNRRKSNRKQYTALCGR